MDVWKRKKSHFIELKFFCELVNEHKCRYDKMYKMNG